MPSEVGPTAHRRRPPTAKPAASANQNGAVTFPRAGKNGGGLPFGSVNTIKQWSNQDARGAGAGPASPMRGRPSRDGRGAGAGGANTQPRPTRPRSGPGGGAGSKEKRDSRSSAAPAERPSRQRRTLSAPAAGQRRSSVATAKKAADAKKGANGVAGGAFHAAGNGAAGVGTRAALQELLNDGGRRALPAFDPAVPAPAAYRASSHATAYREASRLADADPATVPVLTLPYGSPHEARERPPRAPPSSHTLSAPPLPNQPPVASAGGGGGGGAVGTDGQRAASRPNSSRNGSRAASPRPTASPRSKNASPRVSPRVSPREKGRADPGHTTPSAGGGGSGGGSSGGGGSPRSLEAMLEVVRQSAANRDNTHQPHSRGASRGASPKPRGAPLAPPPLYTGTHPPGGQPSHLPAPNMASQHAPPGLSMAPPPAAARPTAIPSPPQKGTAKSGASPAASKRIPAIPPLRGVASAPSPAPAAAADDRYVSSSDPESSDSDDDDPATATAKAMEALAFAAGGARAAHIPSSMQTIPMLPKVKSMPAMPALGLKTAGLTTGGGLLSGIGGASSGAGGGGGPGMGMGLKLDLSRLDKAPVVGDRPDDDGRQPPTPTALIVERLKAAAAAAAAERGGAPAGADTPASPSSRGLTHSTSLPDARLGRADLSISEALQKMSIQELSVALSHHSSHRDSMATASWAVDASEIKFGRRLGAGAYGEVYEAEWRRSRVAVKRLLTAHPLEEKGVKQFFHEMEILANARHDNIVRFLGGCVQPDNLCILFEFCPQSLYDLLRQARSPLPLQQVLTIARQVALGLYYLHCCKPPVLHLDLKSANVLLDKHGIAKVCDFGLAHLKLGSDVRTDRQGSPMWTSPEVLKGDARNEKADTYSYGMLLFELLTRELPYESYAAAQVVMGVITNLLARPELPPDAQHYPQSLQELMKDCWQFESAKRPDFAVVLDALERIAREEGITFDAM